LNNDPLLKVLITRMFFGKIMPKCLRGPVSIQTQCADNCINTSMYMYINVGIGEW